MASKQRMEPVNGPGFAQSAAKGPPLHGLKQHTDALVNTVSRGVDREAAAFQPHSFGIRSDQAASRRPGVYCDCTGLNAFCQSFDH